MPNKSHSGLIKSLGDKGTGTAVFATLNVVDKDGDLTLPGAFGEQKAKLSGAHRWDEPAIGIASVREEADLALADFQFNLEMRSGSEWFKSLKFNFENGVPQEFSYGFDVLEEAYEQRDGRRIRVLKRMKVHEVSPVMIGAGVNTHLRSIKSNDSLTLEDHFALVVESVSGLSERSKALAALRNKEGRVLSRANRTRLSSLLDQLGAVQTDIDKLLRETAEDDEGKSQITGLLAKFRMTEARIAGRL